MNRLIVNSHRGLGDHLICNAIYRHLVEERGCNITIPVWEHNKASVEAMLADLGDAVETLVVTKDICPLDCLNLGHYGQGFEPARWDESFYRQAEVPFIDKFTKFKIPVMPMIGVDKDAIAIFIHESVARGFTITKTGYRPFLSCCIFDHLYALLCAREIHCINSCFAILADLIHAPGKKFLHKYSRPDGVLPIFGQYWTVLDNPL